MTTNAFGPASLSRKTAPAFEAPSIARNGMARRSQSRCLGRMRRDIPFTPVWQLSRRQWVGGAALSGDPMSMTFRTLAAIAAFAIAAGALPASADSWKDAVITEARANAANTMLTVIGANFSGGTPKLTLGSGGVPLTITLATPTQIEALLPAGVPAGSYLLTLTITKGKDKTSNDDSRGDEFWVTLGAVGPQGPAGPAGPAAKDGAIGPPGPAGLAGAAGPAGAAGAKGDTGSQGPAGAAGAKGDTGSQGPAGPLGPGGPAGSTGTPTTFIVAVTHNHVAGDGDIVLLADCPTGSVMTGGAAEFSGYDFGFTSSRPEGNSWRAVAIPPVFPSAFSQVSAYAICLRIN
jgi:Collagen triple helix repeat (20 copies)/IPT/TIG domain